MVVDIPTVCCGLSLRRGVVMIGIFQSVPAFMMMILCSAYADNPHELVEISDKSVVPELHTLKALLILTAVANAFLCVFSILIIFGAETNRPLLLLPWLALNPIVFVIYMIGTLIAIVEHSGPNNTAFILGHLTVGTLVSLIGGFNVHTVYKLYKHLKNLNF